MQVGYPGQGVFGDQDHALGVDVGQDVCENKAEIVGGRVVGWCWRLRLCRASLWWMAGRPREALMNRSRIRIARQRHSRVEHSEGGYRAETRVFHEERQRASRIDLRTPTPVRHVLHESLVVEDIEKKNQWTRYFASSSDGLGDGLVPS